MNRETTERSEVVMDNKDIFASNLKKYMLINGKSRKDICNDLGLSYYTVTDWVNGKKYPRMDKVEMLANYFGILKSDLIEHNEEKPPTPEEQERRDNAQEIARLIMLLPPEHQKMFVAQINAVLAQLKSHPEHQ
jgi:transcriptional regulator with XRE-family HTH domain